MGSLLVSNSLSSFLGFHEQQRPLSLLVSYPQNTSFLELHSSRALQKSRGLSSSSSSHSRVITRAGGGISSSSYIFALVFPLSLLAITIFTSARIADNLDQKFLEELAVNQAIMEGEEDDGSVVTPMEEKPATPRTRNRPKREVEPSTK